MQFAVIKTGGKQYIVSPGKKIKVEKLEGETNAAIVFDRVLLVADGDTVTIGVPCVQGAAVHARVTEQGRADKVIVFRYKAKTRRRTKKGHRQPYTEVMVEKIMS